MKKVVGVFLSLTLAGAVAWAQDEETDAAKPALKLSGSVKTGHNIVTKKFGDDYKTGATMLSDDVGDDMGNNAGKAWRVDLNGIYDADRWGVKFGLRTQRDLTDGTETPGIREAYGWLNLFNKNVKVSSGRIDSAVWNTGGLRDRDLSTGDGLRLEITPAALKGLNIGAAWYGHEGVGSPQNEYMATSPGTFPALESFGDYMTATTIGVSYDSELFYAAVSYRPEGKAKGLSNPINLGITVKNQLIFGFDLKAVEPLTLQVEVLYSDGFDDDGKASNYKPEINMNVGYQINEPLNAGLEAYLAPSGGINKDGKETVDLELDPYVGYKLGETIKLDLIIPLESMLTKKEAGSDDSGIKVSVKPKFTYNFGTGSKLVLFDKLTFVQPEEGIKNTVQIDFVWSF